MFSYENILIKKKNNYHKNYFKFIIYIITLIYLSNSNNFNLSNFLIFNSTKYRAGSFAFNSNGDIIIEYSYNNSRLFYGLKKEKVFLKTAKIMNIILRK